MEPGLSVRWSLLTSVSHRALLMPGGEKELPPSSGSSSWGRQRLTVGRQQRAKLVAMRRCHPGRLSFACPRVAVSFWPQPLKSITCDSEDHEDAPLRLL